jgi:LuxR family maltose regulon positive regulatory protein
VLRLLLNSVDAAVATLSGDLPRALAILEQPVDDVARHDRPEAMTRLHWHLLLLAGRAADAAILAEPAATPANSAVPVRELTATARWFDGDPSGFAVGAVELGPDRYVALSERDRFDQAALVAVMAAAAGEVKAVDEAVAVLQSSPFANTTPPDAAFVAVARAAQLVLVGDEDAAARVLDELLDTFGFGPDGYVDRLTDAHLRRALCVPYVCSPRLRAVWDDAELGPSQRRARAIAGLLLDAREGRAIKDPPHGSLSAMSTLLPLPWSVELAARAAAAGAGWGINLAGVLADRYGDTFEGCLGDLLTSPDRTVASGACILRAALPVAPSATLRIEVVGSLQVRLDDRPIDSPELRRTRVRQLLCALAVERTVTRDRIMDLLWPELDIDKARTNLRVTLTHLQRLLEPHRRPGESPYFVRSDALALRLVDVPGLEVDLWEIDRHLDCAEAARGRGDATTRLEHLGAVTGAWRGRPVPDLDAVAGLDRAGPHVTTRLIEATLSLGELELVRGNATDAAERAEQVLVADPYHERAHRLAIASRLHSRDHTATAAAVGRLRAMLDDLGLGTDDATRMLLHQADRQNR